MTDGDHAQAPATQRIESLDALRGVAVGLVLVHHAWTDWFPSAGIVGVAIFFTLSGYLITGLIESELETTGRFSYRRFYRNRAYRLLPALGVIIVVFVTVEYLDHRLHDPQPYRSALVAAAYLADLPIFHINFGLSHLWSLSVEEQFYLVWPVLFVIAFRRRRVLNLFVSLILLSLICSIVLFVGGATSSQIYTLPTSWAVALLAGGLVKVYRGRALPQLTSWGGFAAASLALSAMSFVPNEKSHLYTYFLGVPLIGGCTAVLILNLDSRRRVPRLLTSMRLLGKISYGAYLWNYLIVSWLRGSKDSHKYGLLSIALSIVAAAGSWYIVERPAQSLKRRRTSGRSSIGTSSKRLGHTNGRHAR